MDELLAMATQSGFADVKSKVKKTISKKDLKQLAYAKGASIRFDGEAMDDEEKELAKKTLKEKFKKTTQENVETSIKGKLFLELRGRMGETITEGLLSHLNFSVGKHRITQSQETEQTPINEFSSPIKALDPVETETGETGTTPEIDMK